jgi:hypothetical protein
MKKTIIFLICAFAFVLVVNKGVDDISTFWQEFDEYKHMAVNLKKIELYPSGTNLPHKSKNVVGVYYSDRSLIRLKVDMFGDTSILHELKHHMCFLRRNANSYCDGHFGMKPQQIDYV